MILVADSSVIAAESMRLPENKTQDHVSAGMASSQHKSLRPTIAQKWRYSISAGHAIALSTLRDAELTPPTTITLRVSAGSRTRAQMQVQNIQYPILRTFLSCNDCSTKREQWVSWYLAIPLVYHLLLGWQKSSPPGRGNTCAYTAQS